MKKIGIMGGTFNPIHKGHVEIAKAAYEQYKLDEVWFMPNHIPAYKSDKGIVSSEHRLNMISLAIDAYEHFKVSDFEIKREGKTYSYETFTLLNREYTDCSFSFIMGADSLFYFEKWVHPEIILDNADILVASRDENGISEIEDRINLLKKEFHKGEFYIIKCPNTDCSSSALRDNISKLYNNMAGEEEKNYIEKYLPERVYEYIFDNNLY